MPIEDNYLLISLMPIEDNYLLISLLMLGLGVVLSLVGMKIGEILGNQRKAKAKKNEEADHTIAFYIDRDGERETVAALGPPEAVEAIRQMLEEHGDLRRALKRILDAFYGRNDLNNTHLYDAMDDADRLLDEKGNHDE